MHQSIDRLKKPGSINIAKVSGSERPITPIDHEEIRGRVDQICPEVCDPECVNYGCEKLRKTDF